MPLLHGAATLEDPHDLLRHVAQKTGPLPRHVVHDEHGEAAVLQRPRTATPPHGPSTPEPGRIPESVRPLHYYRRSQKKKLPMASIIANLPLAISAEISCVM